MFNTFLRDMKERMMNQRGHEFWVLVVKGKKHHIEKLNYQRVM